jgi:lipopolysaccharide export system protein LptA
MNRILKGTEELTRYGQKDLQGDKWIYKIKKGLAVNQAQNRIYTILGK